LPPRNDDQAIDFVLSQLNDPEEFSSKVKELYDNPEIDSFDVLGFKDGEFLKDTLILNALKGFQLDVYGVSAILLKGKRRKKL